MSASFSSSGTSIGYAPKIASVGLHVFVAAALVLYGIGDDDVPALPTVNAIDLIIEQGVIEEPTEEADPEKTEIEDIIPETVPEKPEPAPEIAPEPEPEPVPEQPEQVVEQPTIPDDLKITNDKPEPVEQPIIVDNQIQPALTPKAAQDLALVKEEEQNATFNPEGTAIEDQKSAVQQRADTGSESPDQAEPVDDVTESAKSEATEDVANDNQQVLASPNGDFEVNELTPVDSATSEAEKPETSQADAGKQLVQDDPKPSLATEGEDKINLSDASTDVDAEKVTTPLPKPKPRSIALAFKKEIERQEAAAAEALKKEKEAAEKVAKEKLEQAKKDKAKLELELAKIRDAAKPEEKPAVKPEEKINEQDLTNQLNDQMLALLNEEATTSEQVQKQEAGASALANLNVEVDRISNRIAGSWYLPPGLDIATVPSVSFVLELNADATINTITAKNQERYRNDSVYRQVADSAMRAMMSDGPMVELRELPYEFWKSTTFSFATSDFVRN